MKLYPDKKFLPKNWKFDGTLLFSSYEYFCRSAEQKNMGKIFFLVIKPKRNLFWIKNSLRYWEQLQKRNVRQISFDVGQLELLEVLRSLWNWSQFRSNLHHKYSIVLLWKMFSDSLKSRNFWTINFCWIVDNIMLQIKWFKNTSEGLVVAERVNLFSKRTILETLSK